MGDPSNPHLAFVHGPGFDGPGSTGLKLGLGIGLDVPDLKHLASVFHRLEKRLKIDTEVDEVNKDLRKFHQMADRQSLIASIS